MESFVTLLGLPKVYWFNMRTLWLKVHAFSAIIVNYYCTTRCITWGDFVRTDLFTAETFFNAAALDRGCPTWRRSCTRRRSCIWSRRGSFHRRANRISARNGSIARCTSEPTEWWNPSQAWAGRAWSCASFCRSARTSGNWARTVSAPCSRGRRSGPWDSGRPCGSAWPSSGSGRKSVVRPASSWWNRPMKTHATLAPLQSWPPSLRVSSELCRCDVTQLCLCDGRYASLTQLLPECWRTVGCCPAAVSTPSASLSPSASPPTAASVFYSPQGIPYSFATSRRSGTWALLSSRFRTSSFQLTTTGRDLNPGTFVSSTAETERKMINRRSNRTSTGCRPESANRCFKNVSGSFNKMAASASFMGFGAQA